ncbi:electron transfer flavoprotein subunit beta/FixA family protein [Chloroflexota bacterium]
MNIAVCVKQVIDPESPVASLKIDPSDNTVVPPSGVPLAINPFDLNALEAALQIKDKLGGMVTTISMGALQAESALRDALSRGANDAILLSDNAFVGADTLATSYTLAVAIRKLGGFDLIICGEKTVDGDTGQVGPEIAEHLGIPHVGYVNEIKEVGEKIVLACEMEGDHYLIESGFPLLITVTKDINAPRLPSLSNKLKARKAEIETWTAADLAPNTDQSRFGVQGSPTRIYRLTIPTEEGRKGEILKGTADEAVKRITDAFEERRILQG